MGAPSYKNSFNLTYFNAEEVGKGMEEVACEVIKTEKNSVTSRWYRFSPEVNLYIWEDSKCNIIKQCMDICGQVVEWNIIEGVRTGYSFDEGLDEEPTVVELHKRYQLDHVKYDDQPMAPAVHQAEQVIRKMQILEQNYIEKLIFNFQKSPQADNMDPKLFLKMYGHNLPASELTWWECIIRVFLGFWPNPPKD